MIRKKNKEPSENFKDKEIDLQINSDLVAFPLFSPLTFDSQP